MKLKNIMSLANSLAVLAATSPPKNKPIFNVGKCNRRLRELEAQLGLPSGKDFFNIGKGNARIRELEAQLSQPGPVAQPAQSVGAVQSAAQPAATGDTILPATLTALSKTVFGSDGAENYEGQRLQFSRAGLSVPGLVASPENPHYTVKFVGLARSVRADRQAKVLQFFQAQQH